MRTFNLSTSALAVGLFGIAFGACGNQSLGGAGGSQGASGGSAGTSSTTSASTGGSSGSGVGGTVGSGGVASSGGSKASGGSPGTGGAGQGGVGSGGSTGAAGATGGVVGSGGGAPDGAAGAAGAPMDGGRSDGRGAGGTPGNGGVPGAGGAPGTGGRTTTGGGTCTASKDAGKTVSGSGPHKVVIETNGDAGIKCGTIFRPADLGGTEKYPIFVWGEGGCSQNGLSNQAAMGEIASHGYFIVADGVVSGTACSGGQDGKAFLDYITWAIAENDKPCSAYYQSLDTTKIAADGFSCGGLMSENVSGDPRFSAIGITSSGLMSANKALYDKIHTPFKIMNGGSGDMAYENGLNDYKEISSRGIPIIYFSKTSAGHGGDLTNGKGDFNTVNLAWLNWQLKGDTGATGKELLIGSSCKFCKASGWVFQSANIE